MAENTQIGTSISNKLYAEITKIVKEKGYNSHADFVREAIREKLERMRD